ncbi:MAG: acyl-CoA dehydrogenase family protein [Haloarculaceae archaeon]
MPSLLPAMETVDLTEEQRLVQKSIREICENFGDDYWRERDREEEFPTEFVDTLAEEGWLGALVPEEYGGPGMTTSEVVVMMEEIAASGGGFAAAQAIHGGIYNVPPIVNYGSEAMKEELLPKLARGEVAIQSLGLTEPNAGSDSTSIETFAQREGDEYVINGQKIWISRVDATDYIVLMARTTPKSEVEKRTEGISMFLVDVDAVRDQGTFDMKAIPKTASGAVHSYELWFEDMHVPAESLIGEEGEGFYQVLDGLNEERVVIAAECIGLGEAAIVAGVEYANEREVFDRPIGKNQAIQHPLAEAFAHVTAAKQVVYNATEAIHDADRRMAGVHANTAKYLAAEAAFEAADIAVQAHGGFGVAREYDVERYMREARLTRLVPVAQELALNYLGTKALGLPRSY